MPEIQTRLRGRPQAGADDHRERLVDAARDLFAEAGYAATSLRQISLRAGVTPALAHYYFKDKTGLFDAVARERIAPLLRAMETAIDAHGADAVAALAGFIQQLTLLSSRQPWLPQLLLRETTDDSGSTTGLLVPLARRLQALVAAGQATKAIRPDLPAQSIVLSVLSLCALPFLIGTGLRRELQLSIDAGSAPAMTLHHLAVLQDGLKPRTRAA
jgi:TetR/AcrR family transcriptional regulator